MTTLWDTTGTAIVNELARQRHAGGATISGVALTLIVVADDAKVAEAEEAAATVAAQHPCRILVVVRRQVDTPPRLDAEVLVGGRLGPAEAVVMRMYGRLGLHAESVVVPLLAADVPVVTWWHSPPPAVLATDALAVIADRRITDCSMAGDPLAALRTRADDYAAGDTDLAWTRSTLWRSILTSTLDAAAARRTTPLRLRGGEIEGDLHNATAALVGGWLRWRCGCAIDVVDSGRPTGSNGINAVTLLLDGDEKIRVSADGRGRAVITQPYRADTTVPLPERSLGDLLGEELRRLDADEPYGQALEAATGRVGLAGRPATRQHIWVDPTQPSTLDRAMAGQHGRLGWKSGEATVPNLAAVDRPDTAPATDGDPGGAEQGDFLTR
ncbi:glucose-6-phosphate dehydrogenase [Blastococcus sp. MG754426]|nr:glucose-6-phosphate dehydrogenase [Blastococcus sp. MG754426]MCF6513891.1 glucose-6-phosphate dehydrogenase [Blastococcus sp. MG754427]